MKSEKENVGGKQAPVRGTRQHHQHCRFRGKAAIGQRTLFHILDQESQDGPSAQLREHEKK